MKKIRLAILASLNGTNANAIMQKFHNSDFAEVVCLGSDRESAKALEKAENNNVPNFFIKGKNLEREKFDQLLITELEKYKPDWIILAGYMKILSKEFVNFYSQKILNIHPSLLPDFPGKNSYEEIYNNQNAKPGITVHLVDEGVDTGKILAQFKYQKIPNESFIDFKNRGLQFENQFYPEIIEKIIKGEL